DVLTYTGTERKVLLRPSPEQRGYAAEGGEVTVTLPDGREAAGPVEEIRESSGGEGPAAPQDLTTLVVIGFDDGQQAQERLAEADGGQVRVRFVLRERRDVLTVPGVALVALAEGGYGVEVVDG